MTLFLGCLIAIMVVAHRALYHVTMIPLKELWQTSGADSASK